MKPHENFDIFLQVSRHLPPSSKFPLCDELLPARYWSASIGQLRCGKNTSKSSKQLNFSKTFQKPCCFGSKGVTGGHGGHSSWKMRTSWPLKSLASTALTRGYGAVHLQSLARFYRTENTEPAEPESNTEPKAEQSDTCSVDSVFCVNSYCISLLGPGFVGMFSWQCWQHLLWKRSQQIWGNMSFPVFDLGIFFIKAVLVETSTVMSNWIVKRSRSQKLA